MRKNGYLPLDRALTRINQTLKVQYTDQNLVDLIHERKVDIVFQVDGYVAEITDTSSSEPIQDRSIQKFYKSKPTYMFPDDNHREDIKSLIDGSLSEAIIINALIKIKDKRKNIFKHQDYVLFRDCDEQEFYDFYHMNVTNKNNELFYKAPLLDSFKFLPLHISKLEQNGCVLGVPLTKCKLWITEESLKKFLKTAPTVNEKKIESLRNENEKLLKIIGVMNATIKAKQHHPKITQNDFIQFAKNNLIDDVQITGSMAEIFGTANKELGKYLLTKI